MNASSSEFDARSSKRTTIDGFGNTPGYWAEDGDDFKFCEKIFARILINGYTQGSALLFGQELFLQALFAQAQSYQHREFKLYITITMFSS